ncbi:MAG: hypothetical protein ACPLRU_01305 [Desulfofundulus sp.]
MEIRKSTIEKFSCCSLWQECEKAGRCVQEGNSVISREQYLESCTLARRYREEGRGRERNR